MIDYCCDQIFEYPGYLPEVLAGISGFFWILFKTDCFKLDGISFVFVWLIKKLPAVIYCYLPVFYREPGIAGKLQHPQYF